MSTSTLHPGGYAFDVITSLQRTAGNQAVQRLVRLTRPPAPAQVLTAAQRRAFVRSVFPAGRQRSIGLTIIEDMARTSDVLEFQTTNELSSELRKRVTMSTLMESSQSSSGGLTAFGYPFTGRSLYWGPRVNAAARAYWEPPVADGYDLRRDPARRAEIRRLPRRERYTVYGDPPGGYEWGLSATGKADPWRAIAQAEATSSQSQLNRDFPARPRRSSARRARPRSDSGCCGPGRGPGPRGRALRHRQPRRGLLRQPAQGDCGASRPRRSLRPHLCQPPQVDGRAGDRLGRGRDGRPPRRRRPVPLLPQLRDPESVLRAVTGAHSRARTRLDPEP